MTAKKYSPARRALQVLIVFILSALISRTTFAATQGSQSLSQSSSSCYSNM